jgi:hypothetical protein
MSPVRLGAVMLLLALAGAATFVWLRPHGDVRYAAASGETSVLVSLKVAAGATAPESLVVEVSGQRLVAGRLR